MMVPIPDITKNPVEPLFCVSMNDAENLADAVYEVAQEYDLAKYFKGKRSAIGGLILTAGIIYVPKAMAVFALAKALKAQQRQQQAQPHTAADFMHQPGPTPEAAANATDTPLGAGLDFTPQAREGMYKYG